MLIPIKVSQPFELIEWDLMGPFPTSTSGNRYTLVITESLTRWCEATTVPNITTSMIATTLIQKVIFSHSCPKQTLSDQGTQIKSEVMQILKLEPKDSPTAHC